MEHLGNSCSTPDHPPAITTTAANSSAINHATIQPTDQRPITSTPIKNRPRSSQSLPRSIAFNLFFFFSIISLHITQLIVFPLVFLRSGLGGLFWKFQSLAKKTFGILLVFVTQVFGPTKLVITCDEELDLSTLVQRDEREQVKFLALPKRSVMIANHQIYADWLYIWCLAYLAQLHGSLIIILKASLKWVPIVGPAMQLFSFIFLNRNWASDKSGLCEKLTKMADQVANEEPKEGHHLDQLALLIFPEGTLVSPHTRPISKKFADKMGHPDLRHCLLPRSTGSLFCIRALHRAIPDLQLIDLTIGYPGVPPDGYGQDYYTLQSIFGHGHSPPQVHIHIRLIPISEIPIGTSHLQAVESNSEVTPTSDLVDPTTEEIERFDRWLRGLWEKKDEMLEKFYKDGAMCETKERDGQCATRLEVEVELRGFWDGIRSTVLGIPGALAIGLGLVYVIKT